MSFNKFVLDQFFFIIYGFTLNIKDYSLFHSSFYYIIFLKIIFKEKSKLLICSQLTNQIENQTIKYIFCYQTI